MVSIQKEKTKKTAMQIAAQKSVVQKEKRELTKKTVLKKVSAQKSETIFQEKTVSTRQMLKPKKETFKIPSRSSALSKEQVSELLAFVVHKLDEGKAEDIITIDLAGKTSFADYLVIATATSSRHVMGLMNNLVMDMKKAGYRVQVSGDSGDGNWVVVDLIDIVVHLFTAETRSFYALEDIWNKKDI